MTRYALYFAPDPDHPLTAFGDTWLGRRAADGVDVPRPKLTDLSEAELVSATASPRFYGFHATLKAPFSLAEGTNVDGLLAAVEAFSAGSEPFPLPLTLGRLGRFLALIPAGSVPELSPMAQTIVEAFEPWRAPLSDADRTRRLKSPLTPRQIELLDKFGYPYVADEFRFHMTLSGSLDGELIERVERTLAPLVDAALLQPLRMDGISVYKQNDRNAPFSILRRFRFGG